MPGSIWGNTFKRRFLTKNDIKFHIEKAIKNNNIERLRYYFSLLDNKNVKYNELTFLNIACKHGKLESFIFLLSNGVNIDNDTFTYAINGNNIEIINELIKREVNINAKDVKGCTPLMNVINNTNLLNKLEIFNKLIEHNANVNIVLTQEVYDNNIGTSPLMMAVKQFLKIPEMSQIIKTLLDKNATIDWIDESGKTALMYAIGSKESVEILMNNNANVNIQDYYNNTALIYAINNGPVEVVNELMRQRPGPLEPINLDLQGSNGKTALIHAANIGSVEVVIELTRQHPEPLQPINLDLGDNNGRTALMYAANNGSVEIVDLLIKAGANVDIVDGTLNTAYSLAKSREIKKLINKGQLKEALWTGWTQGDLQKFDSIFNILEQNANGLYFGNTAEDSSYCPICLRFLERPREPNTGKTGGCMYITHECTERAGYYHERLYNLYKSLGAIEWCTICNRICVNHKHYDLVSSDELNPTTIFLGKGPYSETCKPASGGLEEKILRFNAIREKAYELNSLKGTITQDDAMDQLIEAGWNAPINNKLPANFSIKILKRKAWNRPFTNFPPNAPPTATVVALAPDVPVPPERIMPTTKHGENALSMEEGEVIVFYHPVEGTGQSFHEEFRPASLVSRESLTEYITTRIKTARNSEHSLGTCWDRECKAIMYPAEIKDYVSEELYEQYRLKFNEIMAEKRPQRQSGGNNNLILPLTDAKCSIPPRVKRNIGGTRRKRKQRNSTKHKRK